MGDLIFLAVILAFFGVATLLVQACDRIIGPDPDPDPTESPAADDGDALAGAEPEKASSR